MGRLKYEYLKCLPCFILFYLVYSFIETILLGNEARDNSSENILIISLAFVGFIYIIYKQNNDKKCGIYFKNDQMIVLKYKKHTCSWNNIKAERVLKLSSFFHVIRIRFLDSRFSIMIVLFAPSIKSITENTNSYVPKDHDFYKFVDEYNK